MGLILFVCSVAITLFSATMPLNKYFLQIKSFSDLCVDIISPDTQVLIEAIAIDDERIKLQDLNLSEGWEYENNLLIGTKENAPIHIPISAEKNIAILFVKNSNCGTVKLTLDHKENYTYDAYSASQEWQKDVWVQTFEPEFALASQPLLLTSVFFVSVLLLHIVTIFVFKQDIKTRKVIYVFGAFLSLLLLLISITYIYNCVLICGTLLMLLLMASFYGLGVFIWTSTKLYKGYTRREALICFILSLAIAVMVFFLFKQEKFIYYWDYSGYWKMALETSRYICQNPYEGLKWLYDSILVDEYNRWIPLLIGIPLRLLGGSYSAFITVLVLFFLMPTAATYTAIVQRLMDINTRKSIPTILVFVFFALSGALILPTFYGYADAPCIFLIANLTALVVWTDLTESRPARILLLGLSVLHLALMRRAYDYWLVAYAFACILITIISIWKAPSSERREKLKGSIKNLVYLSVIGGLAACIFKQYLINIINSNITFAYQAWAASRQYEWSDFIYNYGPIVLLGSFISVLWGRKRFQYMGRAISVEAITIIVLIIVIVSSGGFAIHTYYQITGQILLLFILGIYYVCDMLEQKVRIRFLSGVAAFTLINFLISIHVVPVNIVTQCFFQSKFYEIKQSETYDDTIAIVDVLGKLPGESPDIYVLGTDEEFNDDILRNALLPEILDEVYIYTTAHVDFREGFYTTIFDADYIVTIYPIEYHLGEEFQKVISIPNELLLDTSSRWGQCYVEFCELPFADRTVKVLKKVKDATADCVREVEGEFDNVYLEYPELFHDRFEEYIEENGL